MWRGLLARKLADLTLRSRTSAPQLAARPLLAMPGMVGPRMGPQTMSDMYGPRALAAELCQTELPGQRMHRYPMLAGSEYRNPEQWSTTSTRSYVTPEGGGRVARSFTMGKKNDLGTKVVTRRITSDEFKSRKLELQPSDAPPVNFTSTAGTSWTPPDMGHPTQGNSAPREGAAPRLPFSEVDRNFFSSNSKGAATPDHGPAMRLLHSASASSSGSATPHPSRPQPSHSQRPHHPSAVTRAARHQSRRPPARQGHCPATPSHRGASTRRRRTSRKRARASTPSRWRRARPCASQSECSTIWGRGRSRRWLRRRDVR